MRMAIHWNTRQEVLNDSTYTPLAGHRDTKQL